MLGWGEVLALLPYPMKLSARLRSILAEYDEQPLALGTLIDRTGEQGMGLLPAVLVLPMLVPLPVPLPMFSTLLGSGIALSGLQIVLNRDRPYLPPRLAKISLPPAAAHRLLASLSSLLRPLEWLARPRLLAIGRHSLVHRCLGACMVWNALLLSLPLPIPFTNALPAYTILMQAIGILEEDGLLILASFGMTAATTAFFASIVRVVWSLLLQLFEYLPF